MLRVPIAPHHPAQGLLLLDARDGAKPSCVAASGPRPQRSILEAIDRSARG